MNVFTLTKNMEDSSPYLKRLAELMRERKNSLQEQHKKKVSEVEYKGDIKRFD